MLKTEMYTDQESYVSVHVLITIALIIWGAYYLQLLIKQLSGLQFAAARDFNMASDMASFATALILFISPPARETVDLHPSEQW